MADPDRLTAADARDIMWQMMEPERRALRMIIEQCERCVRLAATRNEPDCLFRVPLFLNDAPVYRLERVVVDLVKHLRAVGFYARATGNLSDVVYINWKTQPPAQVSSLLRRK